MITVAVKEFCNEGNGRFKKVTVKKWTVTEKVNNGRRTFYGGQTFRYT